MRILETWILIGLTLLSSMTLASCSSAQSTSEVDTPTAPAGVTVVNDTQGTQPIATAVPATKTAMKPPEEQQARATEPAVELTRAVADLVASPQVDAGEDVTIVGVYQGWDWQGQVGTGPPVTRSDWVIADASGAIYVAALGDELGALEPELGNRARVIYLMLKGVVRISQAGRLYIEPLEIRVLGERRD